MASPVISSDLSDSLVASDSDAIVNYAVAPLSSVGTTTNTIDWSTVSFQIGVYDTVLNLQNLVYLNPTSYSSSEGTLKYSLDGTVWDDDKYVISRFGVQLKSKSLPTPGSYIFSMDVSSAFSYDINSVSLYSDKKFNNAETVTANTGITDYRQSSGDVYVSTGISLTNVYRLIPYLSISLDSGLRNYDAVVHISFKPSSGDYTSTAGTDTSIQDYQYGVSNSLNQIDDSLRNLIQHISDQLAALWDQMYNLMHEPTMAKLEEILAVLRAIGNNSDIYAVVEEVRDANRKEIANDNANTGKVEQAVEKHGNFIIEGLKGLFIPSDEYFSTVFNDLNDFFKDKFGFLYTPVDLLIRFINLFSSVNAEFTGIPFPELSWDGYVLLEAQTVQFDMLQLDAFKNVQQKLYFLTDLMMIGALLALIHRKFEEVMQN